MKTLEFLNRVGIFYAYFYEETSVANIVQWSSVNKY